MANCKPLINDAYAWAAKREGANGAHVSFQVSSMKAASKFVEFSEGAFTLAHDGNLIAEKVPVVFSDRAWCPNNSGPFCVPYQKFDYRKADQLTLTLKRNGILNVIHNSRGNSTHNVILQCSGKFLYGILEDANGRVFMTMNLSTRPLQNSR